MVQRTAVPIQSRAQILLAEYNLERAQRGEKPLTIRALARKIHVAPSSLYSFILNKTTRVDFGTLYKLMQFFNVYDMNVMLVRIDDETDEDIRREIREGNGEDEEDGGDEETSSPVDVSADPAEQPPAQRDQPVEPDEPPAPNDQLIGAERRPEIPNQPDEAAAQSPDQPNDE